MIRTLQLTLCCMLLCTFSVKAQVFIDQFANDKADNVFYSKGYTGEEKANTWIIKGDGTAGQYDPFGYELSDATGKKLTVDVSGNNKIYLRVKASKLGTVLRMDLKDSLGKVTTANAITKTLINDFADLEFDFTGAYSDGGYGGTTCTSGPCPVNPKKIVQVQFFVNPGVGGFNGTVTIDYISVGKAPAGVVVSKVWQDQFLDTVSLRYMNQTKGYVNTVKDSVWTITANGTNGAYDNVNILMYNPATKEPTDVSLKDANDKIYVRMKASVPGVAFRVDAQDINGYVTTAGSITKLISQEWATYEYNFNGSYSDLAYGGTGCNAPGPCAVNSERINNLIMFINPGTENYGGKVFIDYISFGTKLEGGEEEEKVSVYGDHFNREPSNASTSGAYDLSIVGSSLKIVGKGGDAPYSSVVYKLYNVKGDQMPTTVNMSKNNLLYVRAKANAATPTLMRVDIQDSLGYVSSKASFTKLLTNEFVVYEIDFGGNYIDAGYGGVCTAGPCTIDAKKISSLQFFPNPADGNFKGEIEIDYVSFGAPLGEDVFRYVDQFEDGDKTKISEVAGLTVTEKDKTMIITGNGTAGAYAAMSYKPHNATTKEDLTLDVTSNNKVYVKVKSTTPVSLRLDLLDEKGFLTTAPSVEKKVEAGYKILEFDFTGTYKDGGYGGTACSAGPCPVDGKKIVGFLLYLDPATGKYKGDLTIDWISTIDPIETIVPVDATPEGVLNYSDDFSSTAKTSILKTDNLAATVAGGVIKIVGNGNSGQYEPLVYRTAGAAGDSIWVNAAANSDDIYVRAKSTVDVELRIDAQDHKKFLTSLAGITNKITKDFQVYKYNFSGKYKDGGYGGTPCTAGPCDVDSKRIEFLQLYIAPGVGKYNGTLELDWISFGKALIVSVTDLNLLSSGKVYPNPASNEMYLEVNAIQSGNAVATITDIAGRTLSTQDLGGIASGNNTKTLNIQNLAKGMYVLSVAIDSKRAMNVKFVVN
jgi:hypothetical protein